MDLKERKGLALFAIKTIFAILVLIYFYVKACAGGDFTIFLAGADAIYHHSTCYHTWFTYQGVKIWNQYSYSPTFALLLAPFSQLPMTLIEFAFLLTYPFVIWRIFKLTWLQLHVELLSARDKGWLVVLLGISTARFFLHNAEEAQVNLLLLYLTMEGLYQLMQNKQKLLGGFLLALGCIIKILPVVFIPYLIYRGEFKASLWTILVLALLILLPIPFLGLPFTETLLNDWWGVINPLRPEYTYLAHVYGQESIQNLGPLIGVLFSEGSFHGLSISVARLSPDAVNLIILIFLSFFILLTLFFIGNYPFTSAKNTSALYYEKAYVFLITPLIFPHQQKYAFIYIFPAYAFIYTFVLFKRSNGEQVNWRFYFLLGLAFCLLTLTTDGLIGMRLSRITQYLKTITWGCFILIVLLAMSDKNVMASKE